MAVIRDVIPQLELFQPTSADDALALLAEHGSDAWVYAGGLDTLDWFKDRVKRPRVVVDLGGVESLKEIRSSVSLFKNVFTIFQNYVSYDDKSISF